MPLKSGGYTCDRCDDYTARDEPFVIEIGPHREELCSSCIDDHIDSLADHYEDVGVITSDEGRNLFISDAYQRHLEA